MTKQTTQNKETVNSEEKAKVGESKPQRDERGRLLPGNTANPKGSKLTEEQKLQKEARKIALERQVEKHIEKIGDALPEITPALIEKAKSGDIPAIKEIHSVLPIEKETSKHEHIVKGAIAHGHFYPEDAQVEADLNKKYKENYRARIKQLPKKES